MRFLNGALCAGLIVANFGLLDVSATTSVAPPTVEQQLLTTRGEMARTRAALDEAQSRLMADDQLLESARADTERLRRHIAQLARSIYISEGQSAFVLVFAAPDLVQGIHAVMEAQAINADSRRDTAVLREIGGRVSDLERDRALAMGQSAQLTQKFQLQLVQTQGLDVWSKVRLWDEANHGIRVTAGEQLGESTPYAWPLPGGHLSQGYGPTGLWFEPPYGGFQHFHTGYDIAGGYGTPVVAAFDGVVIGVGSDGYGYGEYAVIGHPNGTATLYAHLSAISVLAAQIVSRGQQVGAEGSSGNSTGPHLHFEVLVDGHPVDPANFVTKA